MKCKHHKVRSKKGIKYGYCTLKKKEVPIFGCKCNNTIYKEYKPIKKATYKHSKSDKERFSIIYPPLDKCVLCGIKTSLNKHEIIYGKNRSNSIKYGFVISLCESHHREIHNNQELNLFYRKLCQKEFEKTHTREEFIDIFKENYL